jgi:hypothetical protein
MKEDKNIGYRAQLAEELMSIKDKKLRKKILADELRTIE